MAPPTASSATVLLTGTTGFVGGKLLETLEASGTRVVAIERRALDQIASGESFAALLRGSAGVVHLAARAHVLGETSATLLDLYRVANRDLTLSLARAAVAADVRRFVFVSSVRVHGSSSSRPFRPDDALAPTEPYAMSKYEAELGLWDIAAATGLEVVVVRPPLVYGPGVKANFRRLLELAATGLPLPLASVNGMRSLIGVRNLCDLLQVCLRHPAAAGRTFLASDGHDIALPALIRELAAGMGRPARLIPAPAWFVRGLATLAGKTSTFDKLTASLQVDSSATFATLSWRPPISLQDGLRETARWYWKARGTLDVGTRSE